MIDKLEVGIVVQGPAAEILLSNPAARELLGLPESELVGKTSYDADWDILREDGSPFPLGALPVPQAIEQARPVRNVVMGVRRRAQGDRVWLLVNAEPELASDGTVARVICSFSEVTAQMRIRQELHTQNQELEALHSTALDLIERLDLTSVLEAILGRAAAIAGTEDSFLYLAEPGGDELTVRLAGGCFEECIGARMPRGEGLAGRVLASGEALVVDDYRSWPGRRVELDPLAIRALAGVPLRSGEDVAGVLGLAYNDGRTFGQPEIALLTRFGQLASLALENACLYSSLREELHERARAEGELHDAVARLRQSEHDLQLTREEMIRRLSYAAELGDPEMAHHLERMSSYCALLGRRLGFDEERCELLRMTSPLHDVGNIAIPDGILQKPGALTSEERRTVEGHAVIGHVMLAGSGSHVLELAATIAATHHERFDGLGYPHGLAGEAIPIEGRIAGVADTFDALTSDRAYRSALSVEEAIELMREGCGTRFDPVILDLFLGSIDEVLAIKDRHGRRPPPLATLVPGAAAASAPAASPRALARREPSGALELHALRTACEEAERILVEAADPRRAIDAALDRLGQIGPELLVSVYVREHDRLWLVAQRNYDQVRDGFMLGQGVMARAVRTACPQFIADVDADDDFIPATTDIRSELAVPFGPGSPALGVLNVETRSCRLPPEAEHLFDGIAGRLAELTDRLAGHVGSELPDLARALVYASSLRGVDAIADFAARALGRLLDLESAQVNIGVDPGGRFLASFWRKEDSKLRPLAADQLAVIAPLVEPAEAAYSILDLAAHVDLDVGERPRWLVWLPLRVAGTEIGTLVGQSVRRLEFELEQAETTMLFAQHAAALLDVAQALRREQRAAATDALTGLLNRRGFQDRFQEELRRAERLRRTLSIIFLDCDDLKAINDRYGHDRGDAVLQSVARFVKMSRRADEIVARLGGDEFALVLPDADRAEALVAAERLRSGLVEHLASMEHAVTVTLGVATYPLHGSTAADLMRTADRALYKAKQGGKNRTIAFAAD